ncbi:MAG: ceramidase domain-containing protein [Gemmatimonadetes bacterium]|nr:ceramidase domain-containing protein [Gemmatimonadota bacterium]
MVGTFAPGSLDWSSWRQATCMPAHCFNEAVRDGWIRQPSNTWSSLAFVVVAALLVLRWPRGADGMRPSFATSVPLRTTLAFALVVTGLGSAFFHASLTFVGQTADVAGMYLIGTFLIIHARLADAPGTGRQFVTTFVAANLVLLIALVLVPELRRQLFALLIVVGLVLEVRRARAANRRAATPDAGSSPRATLDLGRLERSGITLAVAFAIWGLDMLHVGPSPTAWVQGHAIWHVLGAVSAGQLARYLEGRA